MSHKILRFVYIIFPFLLFPSLNICSGDSGICMRISVKYEYLRQAFLKNYVKEVDSSFNSKFRGNMKKFEAGYSAKMEIEAAEGIGVNPEVAVGIGLTHGNDNKDVKAACRYYISDKQYQEGTMQIYRKKELTYTVEGESATVTDTEYVDTERIGECKGIQESLKKKAEEEINYRYDCTPLEKPLVVGPFKYTARYCEPGDTWHARFCRVSGTY